jgi:hypothetical protein
MPPSPEAPPPDQPLIEIPDEERLPEFPLREEPGVEAPGESDEPDEWARNR